MRIPRNHEDEAVTKLVRMVWLKKRIETDTPEKKLVSIITGRKALTAKSKLSKAKENAKEKAMQRGSRFHRKRTPRWRATSNGGCNNYGLVTYEQK